MIEWFKGHVATSCRNSESAILRSGKIMEDALNIPGITYHDLLQLTDSRGQL